MVKYELRWKKPRKLINYQVDFISSTFLRNAKWPLARLVRHRRYLVQLCSNYKDRNGRFGELFCIEITSKQSTQIQQSQNWPIVHNQTKPCYSVSIGCLICIICTCNLTKHSTGMLKITYSSDAVLESRFRTSDNHLRRFCCDFLFVKSWTRIIPKQHNTQFTWIMFEIDQKVIRCNNQSDFYISPNSTSEYHSVNKKLSWQSDRNCTMLRITVKSSVVNSTLWLSRTVWEIVVSVIAVCASDGQVSWIKSHQQPKCFDTIHECDRQTDRQTNLP